MIDAAIAALVAAERGSNDLTATVYEALGYSVLRRPAHPRARAWAYLDPDTRRWVAMEFYTTSLDAALKLVPERLYRGVFGPMPNGFLAVVSGGQVRGVCEGAPTPELALCIAALRARLSP
jgi:hypothetical protein